MVLEATVIILDNSEYMRNGDLPPSRFDAQAEAVTMLFNAKRQSNVENSVSLMTMAETSPKVLVTLTNDPHKISHALNSTKLGGQAHFISALQVAQLVLKNRQNLIQHQRIVVFVGSPLSEASVEYAGTLKDLDINVDVIAFGAEQESNLSFLKSFIDAVTNAAGESHLLTVPHGARLVETVRSATEVFGDGTTMAGDEYFDPEMDPELAMALKLSLEEEQARQATSAPNQATKVDDDKQQVANDKAQPEQQQK